MSSITGVAGDGLEVYMEGIDGENSVRSKPSEADATLERVRNLFERAKIAREEGVQSSRIPSRTRTVSSSVSTFVGSRPPSFTSLDSALPRAQGDSPNIESIKESQALEIASAKESDKDETPECSIIAPDKESGSKKKKRSKLQEKLNDLRLDPKYEKLSRFGKAYAEMGLEIHHFTYGDKLVGLKLDKKFKRRVKVLKYGLPVLATVFTGGIGGVVFGALKVQDLIHKRKLKAEAEKTSSDKRISSHPLKKATPSK